MITDTLITIYRRDLERLRTEVGQYSSDYQLWQVQGEISNSGGNLALHLVSNLQHFIGAILGDSGYVRDREAEFASKDISHMELNALIDGTAEVVSAAIANLSADELADTYPIEVFGEPMTTEHFLVHLTTHLSYHLGQINYHRRLLAS